MQPWDAELQVSGVGSPAEGVVCQPSTPTILVSFSEQCITYIMPII